MASTSISVARILQLRVPIAWQEAVEVANAADKLSQSAPAALTLNSCLISEEGTVALDEDRFGTPLSPLQLLGRMLQGQAAPPELRALVMAAEDSLESFPSELDGRGVPKELSLDWFLRPNPAIEIAKLAARARAAESAQAQSHTVQQIRAGIVRPRPGVAEKAPAAIVRRVDTPPARESATDWRDQVEAYWRANGPATWPPRRKVQMAAAAILAVLALAGTALGRAWFADPAPIGAVPQARWVQTMAAVANTPASGDRSLPERALPERGASTNLAEPREPVSTSGSAAMSGPAAVERASTPPASAEGTGLTVNAGDGSVVRTRELQVVFPTEPPPARPVVPAPSPPAAAVASDRAAIVLSAPERRVYSAEDAGVAPPEMIRPQLPSERKADTEPTDSWVEVVVDERGQVAQVRLHSTDASLNDRMLVAAAKAWQFQPALKDGRPVKYILRVPVTY